MSATHAQGATDAARRVVRIAAIGGLLIGVATILTGTAHPFMAVLTAATFGAGVAQLSCGQSWSTGVAGVLLIVTLGTYGLLALANAPVVAVVVFSLAGALAVRIGGGWLRVADVEERCAALIVSHVLPAAAPPAANCFRLWRRSAAGYVGGGSGLS